MVLAALALCDSPGEGPSGTNSTPPPPESPAEACCRVGPLSAAVRAQNLLKEVAFCFITSTMVWLQVKQQGGNTAPPITENWIKNLLSMAPPIRTRPSFPLSQSLPSRSFHKPLIPMHQKAGRLKTAITEN